MIALAGKWIVRLTLLLLILCVLTTAIVAFVLNTKSGTAWAIARIDAALPGKLDTAEFDGTLWRGLHFKHIEYADETQRVEVEQLSLNLHWPAVIAGRLSFETLNARAVTRASLRSKPTGPQPFELAMSPLPIVVAVAKASVDELVLTSVDKRQSFQDIDVERVRITESRFQIAKGSAANELLSGSVESFSMALSGKVRTSGEISWELQDGSWSGRGSVRGNLVQLEFQQDVVGQYPATVAGALQILDRIDPEFDALINWDSWLVGGREVLEGEVHLQGVFENYAAAYDTTIVLSEQQRIQLSGTAVGNPEGLSEFEARITAQPGAVDLSGRLAWLPEFSANATARTTNIDPSTFRSELNGRLNATANLILDKDGALTVKGLSVTGILNDAPVRGDGEMRVSSERQHCLECTLHIADNRISVDGSNTAEGLSLSFSLNAPALSQLWPGLGGAAVASGRIDGPIDNPQLNGAATLEKFAYQDADFGKFVLSWRGSLGGGDVSVDWRYQDLEATANGKLQYDERQFTGVIRNASFAKDQLGSWSLANAFSFRVAERDMSVESNEWNGALGELRISHLSLTDEMLRTVATVRKMPLELGNRVLPKNYQLSGFGNADIDLTRALDQWSGSVHWEQTDTVLRVTDSNEDVTEVIINRAEANASLSNEGVIAKANIGIDPGVTGELNVTLKQLSIDTAMTGSLWLQGDDWSWISAVVPQIDRFEGAISAALAAEGPLNAPEFSGTAEWQSGRLAVPSSNVLLEQIGVVITGAPDGDATITGSAKAGDGSLQLTGRLSDLMQATRSASFNITGEGAELVNWPEYRIWGSPDLELKGNSDAWHMTGQLGVPRADIELHEVPVGAVTLSPDVVVLGEEDKLVRETRLTAETRLLLGKSVRFEGLGLDTKLEGDLLFKLADGRELNAEGRLSLIDGTYEIYGRKLSIEQGELVFTGPLDDPIVDVRAVRVIDTIDGTVKAGIRLSGRAQNLTSSVYSEPPMADADALSYLVIGRPLNQATESDGGELSGAAIALGLRQATRITDQIGQTLGLDQLSLAGDGGETTALVAGKQINSRLHARYAYGVFSRLGTLLLRYRMSNGLTLEAGAGENQSIDVLYSIEK